MSYVVQLLMEVLRSGAGREEVLEPVRASFRLSLTFI